MFKILRDIASQKDPKPLPEAIHEAQTLLSFASRQGIEITPEAITNVAKAASALEKNDTTAELEIGFWPAFREIAKAVAPATLESINATRDEHPERSTLRLVVAGEHVALARWIVFQYRLLAIGTLFAVIAIQIFWIIGASLTNDIVSLDTEIAKLDKKQTVLQMKLGGEAGGSQEAADIIGKIGERRSWVAGSFRSLKDWNRLWGKVMFFIKKPFEGKAFEKLNTPAKNRIELTSAGFVLQGLTAFILPLMYGLLGACTYVLRDLSREIREVTLSRSASIRYGLRLSLGPLAGIAVGLIFVGDTTFGAVSLELANQLQNESNVGNPESEGIFQGVLTPKVLSPLALAFVAGYSVEILFNGLDRLIFAFTGSGEDSARRV